MSFSEQIQRLCSGLSAEQVVDLRALIVEASERQHANPSVFSMSLQTLRQKLVYQGFDWDDLLGTLQQLAKGSLEATKQAAFAADCEMFMARDASIAEFASMLSADYSDLQKVLEQLVEAAQEDQRSLTAIAGGMGNSSGSSRLTKKQKWEIGLGVVGIAGGTALAVKVFRNKSIPEAMERVAKEDNLSETDLNDIETKTVSDRSSLGSFVADSERWGHFSERGQKAMYQQAKWAKESRKNKPISIKEYDSDEIDLRSWSHRSIGIIEEHSSLEPGNLRPQPNRTGTVKEYLGDSYNISWDKTTGLFAKQGNELIGDAARDAAGDAAGDVSRVTDRAVKEEDNLFEDMF